MKPMQGCGDLSNKPWEEIIMRLQTLKRRHVLAAAVAVALGSTQANAVELQAGDWTVDVGGIVNAYATSVSCSGASVGGDALAGRALGCSGENSKTTIGNGLLPSGLITKFKTNQDGIEIGGTIGIMVAAATTSSIAANSSVDVRQAFFTVGTAQAGTFKIGRDYGVFGSNAILGDMTLVGAGAPDQATQRGRVTLGHIGAGYTYLGTYGQMTYISPVMGGGFTFTGALVSPVDASANYVSNAGPQIQAQLAWAGSGFKAWLGAKAQKFAPANASSGTPPPTVGDADQSYTETAGEIGASYTAGPFAILANYQEGKGLGILSDGDQGAIKGRNYFVQGTYQLTEKVKLGLNYGQSRNTNDDAVNDALNASFKSNSNVTAGVYYNLTKSVTLSGELGDTRSNDYLGNTAKMFGGSFGGIIFF
jgi:predicted porin